MICLDCKDQFIATYKNSIPKYCSEKCKVSAKSKRKIYRKENFDSKKHLEKIVANSHKKIPDTSDKNTFIECPLTGYRAKELTAFIIYILKITPDEYRRKTGLKKLKCKKLCEKVLGKNNPAYDHKGRLSPFSKNFLHGDISKQTQAKARQSMSDNNSDTTKLSYWLEKTHGDLEKATELLSERQSTFSLKKCIERHGEIEGQRVWKERQEKWLKTYKKSNFSKISQELFWNVYREVKDLFSKNDVMFAQFLNGECDLSGKNHEYILVNEHISCKPDFIILSTNKIIEFQGDYWHNQNKKGNKSRDDERTKKLIMSGYDVLEIPERWYRKNKEEVIKKCINFLTQ